MSYNDRIDAALAAIKEHNEAVGGEGKAGYLSPDEFIQCVKASGGTSEERLSALSHEDLLACMPASPNGVKPRVLAKEIADIFRSKSAASETDEKRPISGKKADKMTPRELVEAFDPEDYSNAVGVRLATISKGEKFIVYSNGRIVDGDSTFKLLLEIKSGYPGRDDVDVNGVIKKTYRIGELPENYADENPLYRDRPLRPDGTCDQSGRSWEGVDLSVRQLIRVAMDEGELRVTHEIAHDTLDIVMETDALKKLRSRYRKAAIKFDELAKTGNLPTLKIPLGGGSEGTNPFSGGKQVVWGQSPVAANAYIKMGVLPWNNPDRLRGK
jgi:hypothetical protein